MARKPQDVTDAELAVLQVLWDEGPVTTRRISEQIYDDPDAQYSTVKRLLTRLEDKGFVARDAGGPVLLFSATLTRDELIGRRIQAVADTLCEGSISPLLTQLAQADSLSQKQRQTLLDLIEDLKAERPGPRKRQTN